METELDWRPKQRWFIDSNRVEESGRIWLLHEVMTTEQETHNESVRAGRRSTLERTVSRQAVFSSGRIAVDETPVESTLSDHGIDLAPSRPSRIDVPPCRSFVDERRIESSSNGSGDDQTTLFAATSHDQRTLDGSLAAIQPLFGSSTTDGDGE